MLSLDVLLVFVVVACGFMLIPGPAMIYMATVGVDRGRNAGLAAAVGLAVGDLVLASAAALGLTAVLAASETLFLAFKVCGVGYLVWLGVRRLLTSMEPLDATVSDGSPGRSRARWGEMGRGFLVSLANPKDALFFVALLPQFATATSGQGQGQMLLLGAVFAVGALCFDSCYALLSAQLRRLLVERPRIWRSQRWVSGGAYLVMAGLAAASPVRTRAA
ncbi:LysE family translocator [Nesterenkonia halophila]